MKTIATFVPTGLTFVVLLAGSVNAQADENEKTRLDCGVNALYLLLRLEGRPASVDRILSKLPARHPDGYSMAELAAASEALGLGLEGVRFAKGDPNPNRPAIAFVKTARGGHFTVLRPVGSTGAMVQVIDPPIPPWTTDYDRLFVDGLWTDRILMPRPPWSFLLVSTGGLSAAVAALFFWLRGRSSRASKAVAPQPS